MLLSYQNLEASHKYLGLIVDEKLFFEEHVEQVRRKAYTALKIISPYTQPATRL